MKEQKKQLVFGLLHKMREAAEIAGFLLLLLLYVLYDSLKPSSSESSSEPSSSGSSNLFRNDDDTFEDDWFDPTSPFYLFGDDD